MKDKLHEALEEYGLNDKAATVYLTALQIGSGSAATIARISKIKRVTTYSVLQDLVRKGIIREITKDGVKVFSAVEPEKLVQMKKKEVERFESVLPMFSEIRDKYGNKPKMEYLEGLSGLKKYYDMHLESGKDIYSFLSVTHVSDQLRNYLENVHVPDRLKRKIFARVLVPNTEANINTYAGLDEKAFRETIVINNPIFETGTGIDLFGEDNVGLAMFSGDEMSAAVIKSPKLYMTIKAIFDLLRDTYGKS